MSADPNCIFCKIASGEIPAAKIAESEHCFAILDAFPAAKGHVLVISKDHRENPLEMSAEETSDCALLIQKTAAAVKKAANCPGINIINNTGKPAGQVVMHAHYHILPRFEDDSFQMIYGKLELSPAEMEEIGNNIKKQF
ncbi:MAG TPA: HIT family protein [bacterium]|nr:HIT family protein [bacterium]